MKQLLFLLALSMATGLLYGQASGRGDFKPVIDDPDNILVQRETLGGTVIQYRDFKMAIVPPDPRIDCKIVIVRPDPNADFKMIVIDPKTMRELSLPKNVEDRAISILREHRRK